MPFNKNFNRETLTTEEVESLAEFKGRLNEQQQNFVRHWIASGGDQFFAFSHAYNTTSAEEARKGSYAVTQRKSIQTVIDLFLMRTPKELFLGEVNKILRSRKLNPSKLRALELKAQMLFGVDLKTLRAEAPAASAETKPHKVGDVIDYDGKKVRVTKVDGNGQPVEGDPVVTSPESW
jgi:hypothetical protein